MNKVTALITHKHFDPIQTDYENQNFTQSFEHSFFWVPMGIAEKVNGTVKQWKKKREEQRKEWRHNNKMCDDDDSKKEGVGRNI